MPPTISIIIPAYNAARYLAESIRSVQEQVLPPDVTTEIVVANDCSTDTTAQIATDLGCLVFSNPTNQGAGIARNLGLQHAQGDYLLFHDSDDLLTTNALATLYQEFTSHPNLQAVFAMREDFISPDLAPAKKATLKPLPAGFGAMAGCALFKAEVFDIIGNFDANLIASDIDWQMKLSDAGVVSKQIPVITCRRRLHENNFSYHYVDSGFSDYAKLLRKRLTTK